MLMRLRTLSCAMTIAPPRARFWLPPVWSPCQWVLMTNLIGCGEAMAMGERSPVALLDAPASGRLAVGEALTNIARHAGAGKVGITLTRDHRMLKLFIRDDGRGFDLAAAGQKKGFGFFGMRERVLAVVAERDVGVALARAALGIVHARQARERIDDDHHILASAHFINGLPHHRVRDRNVVLIGLIRRG